MEIKKKQLKKEKNYDPTTKNDAEKEWKKIFRTLD